LLKGLRKVFKILGTYLENMSKILKLLILNWKITWS